eukprot:3514069-Alexandrium_andersonii.AAC.1
MEVRWPSKVAPLRFGIPGPRLDGGAKGLADAVGPRRGTHPPVGGVPQRGAHQRRHQDGHPEWR